MRIPSFWRRASQTEIKHVETVIDASKKYIDNAKEKFLTKSGLEDKNTNVSFVFYSKPEYELLMKEATNHLEKEWKTRILFESTPKGNIIMYYDAYKLGFAYFSDVNGIDYTLLNAIAMKYVITYRCVDFFVDEEYMQSPLIKLYFTDDVKPTNKNTVVTDGPFIKHNTNKKSSELTNEKKSSEKEYNRNKFIFMGKMLNFQFTQKTKKTNIPAIKPKETILMSYSEYKTQTRNH